MRTGVPCNENRFFPVRISTQGKPCSGPVLALYGIAVCDKMEGKSNINMFVCKICSYAVMSYVQTLLNQYMTKYSTI